jgi:hypothetical protein
MRDADETIKTLLAGFRDAEPPGGMQTRILQAVELLPAASTGLRPAFALAFVFAAVLMAGLTVAVRLDQPWHKSASATRQVTHVVLPQPAQPNRTAVKATAGLRQKTPRTAPTRPREETQLASYPAPALPLTEQERLLLRLAHRHDVQNVAILNRDVQTAASAEAAKQFQQFFGIDAKETRNESE